MISYIEARRLVAETTAECAKLSPRRRERVALGAAAGRVLSQPLAADRDAPPFDRSTRDGYALRYSDIVNVPATLKLAGEIRAGEEFTGRIRVGECVQIMTGAAVPADVNAVVMIEHTTREGDAVTFQNSVKKGANIVPRGSEAGAGAEVVPAGRRLAAGEIAIAAQFGHAQVEVFARPRIAILTTGDELVGVGESPRRFEIRNSNALSLAAQVQQAGGEPVELGRAKDERYELRAKIEQGLDADALVLSGGVSMGKYDLVEEVLREVGAQFRFDAVAIRPGKPAVFGVCRGKPVLGLPGNPVSTIVTFELFGVPIVDVLSGAEARPLPLAKAKLGWELKLTAKLTHFLPARLTYGPEATAVPLPSQGSGDVAVLSGAACFIVVPETRLEHAVGDWVDVLLWRDRL